MTMSIYLHTKDIPSLQYTAELLELWLQCNWKTQHNSLANCSI